MCYTRAGIISPLRGLTTLTALLLVALCVSACAAPTSVAPPEASTASASHPDTPPTPTPRPLPATDLPSYIKSGWRTDFTKHSIDYAEIVPAGVPRDGIPAIDAPRFVGVDAASVFVSPDDPVLSLHLDGAAKAYPLSILMRHEIVNDTLAGVPVAITYCPLCNSGIVFERSVDGATLDFGVTGNLRFSDLLMWDRQTESWWQQLTGEAVVGELTGARLTMLPAAIVSFAEFAGAHPHGEILTRDTGYERDYDTPAYAGYDSEWSYPALLRRTPDLRLPSLERVLALRIDGKSVAYPFSHLRHNPVIHDSVSDTNIVIFYSPHTLSPFGTDETANPDGQHRQTEQVGRSVGAATAHIPIAAGMPLSFTLKDGRITDEQTASEWNILGKAVSGALAGETLQPIVHGSHFWFAWAAFHPDTEIRGKTPIPPSLLQSDENTPK